MADYTTAFNPAASGRGIKKKLIKNIIPMNERPQHIVVRQFMVEVLLTAIYFNFLSIRIFMISV